MWPDLADRSVHSYTWSVRSPEADFCRSPYSAPLITLGTGGQSGSSRSSGEEEKGEVWVAQDKMRDAEVNKGMTSKLFSVPSEERTLSRVDSSC